MRLFAICCYAVALFYGWTAVDSMRTGVACPLIGARIEHRRDDPGSHYGRYVAARWLYSGGFAALGVVMQVMAGRFEKLERDERK